MHLGIFDSGIGGTSILSKVLESREQRHHIAEITYFADNAFIPYGNRDQQFISGRAEFIYSYLRRNLGCNIIICACHTASAAVMLDAADDGATGPYPGFIGVIEPTVEAIAHYPEDLPTVIVATRFTIESGIYQRQLLPGRHNSRNLKNIAFIAAPNLATQIESGSAQLNLPSLPLDFGIDHHPQQIMLVLACTHYPLEKERIIRQLFAQHHAAATAMPPLLFPSIEDRLIAKLNLEMKNSPAATTAPAPFTTSSTTPTRTGDNPHHSTQHPLRINLVCSGELTDKLRSRITDIAAQTANSGLISFSFRRLDN